MKKTVITAFDVTTARKAGQKSIAVPGGALVTPQAADDARDYGIALTRDGQIPAPDGRTGPGGPAVPATPDIAGEIRRQILARLGNAAPASLDAIIAAVLADVPASPATGAASFIRKAGAVSLVMSSALPAGTAGSGPAAVSMVEALPPSLEHPGIAYMRWENASFAWTFERDEVLVVLEGEIALAAAEGTLAGKPGDAFRIPAGSSVTLSAKGAARCVHSSWSNPATAKG